MSFLKYSFDYPFVRGFINLKKSTTFNIIEREEVRSGEFPSGNVHASARGLGKLAAAMANEGKMLDGRQLISAETWHKMHQNATLNFDAGLGNVLL